jgi:hypothetical protein
MSSFHAHDAAPWDSIAAAIAAEGGLKPRAAANPSPGGFPGASEILSREARPATGDADPWGEIAASLNAHGSLIPRARQSHAAASPRGFNAAPRYAASTTTGALPWAVIAARINAEAGFKARVGEEYPEPAASPLGEAETSSLSLDAARIYAILYSPAAKGRDRFARYLAYETAMSAEDAISAIIASAGLASASPAEAQTYRAPPAPVAASAPSSSPVVASPRPAPRFAASNPTPAAASAQSSAHGARIGGPLRPLPYDPKISPSDAKIRAEYRAAARADGDYDFPDFWSWLAEKYPPPPGTARG